MMSGKIFLSTALFSLIAFASLSCAAQEDVRGVRISQPELRVIEAKCLNCHNRKRIDSAVREQRDMEKVLSSMEKKGVVLTDKDRGVIGHFWQQRIFKEKKGE